MKLSSQLPHKAGLGMRTPVADCERSTKRQFEERRAGQLASGCGEGQLRTPAGLTFPCLLHMRCSWRR